MLRSNGNLGRTEIAHAINAGEATIGRDLATLQKLGVISRKGADKNGKWIVNK